MDKAIGTLFSYNKTSLLRHNGVPLCYSFLADPVVRPWSLTPEVAGSNNPLFFKKNFGRHISHFCGATYTSFSTNGDVCPGF